MERFPLGPVLDHYGVQYVDNYTGWQSTLCPVHDESRPSCSVNLDAKFFDCHACGARGGVLDILKAREGLTGEAAVARAEEICGVRYADLRGEPAGFSGRRVPQGQGYKPGFRRAAPARLRARGAPWV